SAPPSSAPSARRLEQFAASTSGYRPPPTSRWFVRRRLQSGPRTLVYTRTMSLISDRIEAYGRWRSDLLDAVERYQSWLSRSELSDPQLQARLSRIMDHLRDDRMTVA